MIGPCRFWSDFADIEDSDIGGNAPPLLWDYVVDDWVFGIDSVLLNGTVMDKNVRLDCDMLFDFCRV